MGEAESPLDAHWRSFTALREDVRLGRLLLGIDRSYARNWMLRGGPKCPFMARLAGYLLVILALLSALGAAYVGYYRAYLLAAFLLLLAYLSWRFLIHLAVANLRSAALRDEALFRRCFDERRLSIFVKDTGQYVWNDRGGPS